MALKGTIKDFGVADIFQLISQQLKTGVLVLRNQMEEVKVTFLDGTLVGASHSVRSSEQLLGSLLVRAEVVTQKQLDEVLQEQQRTLQKVGDVLIDQRMATPADIKEFTRLQMTETVYGLFEWTDGTYEFETEEVDPRTLEVEPMRAETVVMNGIRMTDEWPSIREKIPSYSWLVEPMRALPARSNASSDEFDLSSLSEFDGGGDERSSVGDYERRVFELIAPGRTVQKIIDLSRLGEFEACAALSELMSEGFIRVVKPPEVVSDAARARLGWRERARRTISVLGRVVVSVGIVVVAALLLSQVSPMLGQGGLQPGARYVPAPVDERIAEAQLRVLRRAVEVYRYQTGAYPQQLEDLVDARLIRPTDVRFPFHEPYFYAPRGASFVLLRPFR